MNRYCNYHDGFFKTTNIRFFKGTRVNMDSYIRFCDSGYVKIRLKNL